MSNLLCDDFESAARNREMVANKEQIIGYILVEEAMRKLPSKSPLPDWISLGFIPSIPNTGFTYSKHIPLEDEQNEE